MYRDDKYRIYQHNVVRFTGKRVVHEQERIVICWFKKCLCLVKLAPFKSHLNFLALFVSVREFEGAPSVVFIQAITAQRTITAPSRTFYCKQTFTTKKGSSSCGHSLRSTFVALVSHFTSLCTCLQLLPCEADEFLRDC